MMFTKRWAVLWHWNRHTCFTVLANRLIHAALLAPPTVTVFAEDVPIHGIAFPGMIEHKRSP